MKLQLFFLLAWLLATIATVVQADEGEMKNWGDRAGVHILSDYGHRYSFISSEASELTLRRALDSVDWVNGFHQVVVVRCNGASMEVGGSLDEDIGLAAVYRISPEKVESVIIEPPATVDEMFEILVAFSQGGDAWREIYKFD